MIEWPASGAGLVRAKTMHRRRGGPAQGPQNGFTYGVDLALLRMQPNSHDRALERAFSPMTVRDRDHGVERGSAAEWAIGIARSRGLPEWAMVEVWLLTQPRRFGLLFNPVSFWFCLDAEQNLRAVIAEVNNTFGDRHAYYVADDALEPLQRGLAVERPKRMYVSPFLEISGDYRFKFRLSGGQIDIEILHQDGPGGLIATLSGQARTLTFGAWICLLMGRPFAAVRVPVLIHWQALKLKLKGAHFRRRPEPPIEDVTG